MPEDCAMAARDRDVLHACRVLGGACPRCGYSLRGIIILRCPECGSVPRLIVTASPVRLLPWCVNLVMRIGLVTYLIVELSSRTLQYHRLDPITLSSLPIASIDWVRLASALIMLFFLFLFRRVHWRARIERQAAGMIVFIMLAYVILNPMPLVQFLLKYVD